MLRILILGALLLVTPSICFSAILFSDNFDSQADWEPTSSSECNTGDCSSVVPTGWSYYRSMGVFNPSTSPSGQNTVQINSSQHHGTAGKAYIQYAESTTEWSADGQLTYVDALDHTEVWVKFYFKTQYPYQRTTSTDMFQKIFRVGHYDRSGNIYDYNNPSAVEPHYIYDIKYSLNWGGSSQSHSYRSAPGYNYLSNDASIEWPNWDWGDSGDPTDGEWHEVKMQFILNSAAGVADGVHRYWYDGNLVHEDTAIEWITSGPLLGFNYFALGGNQHNVFTDTTSGDEQWIAFDDVVFGTAEEDVDNPSTPGGKLGVGTGLIGVGTGTITIH